MKENNRAVESSPKLLDAARDVGESTAQGPLVSGLEGSVISATAASPDVQKDPDDSQILDMRSASAAAARDVSAGKGAGVGAQESGEGSPIKETEDVGFNSASHEGSRKKPRASSIVNSDTEAGIDAPLPV